MKLLYRISTQDTDELMPPPEHGSRLKLAEVAFIRNGFSKVPSGANIGLIAH